MALPIEQEFIALKQAVEQLQQAQADKWIRDFALVIVGALAGAIPTIAIAIISNRWSKRLFYMTRDKEEHVLKSKLFGEIRVAEGRFIQSASDTILQLVMQMYYLFRLSKAPQERKATESKELDKYQSKLNDETNKWLQAKAEFIRAVSEYNYFLKDKKLDSLLSELDTAPLIEQLKFSDYTYTELISDETQFLVFKIKVDSFNKYDAKLKDIVQHILSTTSKE